MASTEIVESRRAYTAFAGEARLVSGTLADVAVAVATAMRRDPDLAHHVFDDATGNLVELDLRGTEREIRRRIRETYGAEDGVKATGSPVKAEPSEAASEAPIDGVRRRGRPRLGVVAREVTLLPRHWEWLNEQPGGASVVLRRLVEEARKSNADRDRRRRSQEATYQFMVVMAGNREGFEEATRALFAGDARRFDAHTASWPIAIADYSRSLARGTLGDRKTASALS
ncbi:MAG: DUF2239 family protein [Verrucomicrobiales bacterium]|nr:DUF2239 family protein [Verrucomicrobiales bacterium]